MLLGYDPPPKLELLLLKDEVDTPKKILQPQPGYSGAKGLCWCCKTKLLILWMLVNCT